MPRPFEGPRVKKLWIASRQEWRVKVVSQDKLTRVRHFKDEKKADEYAAVKAFEIQRLKEVLVDPLIVLYEKERLPDLEEKSVVETTRRLRAFFSPVLRFRVAMLTDRLCKELYFGAWAGTELTKHGLVNRPTLRGTDKNLRPGEAGCHLPCRCKGMGPPLSADSHRNYLAEAKTFLRWCVRKEFIGQNPLEKVEGMGKRNPGGLGKSSLRRKELRLLFNKALEVTDAGDERGLGVLFALLFGMRASEITTRQCRDIDEETWTVEVDPDAAKTEASDRDNLIPEVLRPAIKRAMKGKRPDQYLFGDGDRPHWRDWVSESTRRLCILARIPIEHAHALRGAHEDLAKAAGQTAEAICQQLGHTDARTGDRSYTTDTGRRAARKVKQANVLQVLEGGKSGAAG